MSEPFGNCDAFWRHSISKQFLLWQFSGQEKGEGAAGTKRQPTENPALEALHSGLEFSRSRSRFRARTSSWTIDRTNEWSALPSRKYLRLPWSHLSPWFISSVTPTVRAIYLRLNNTVFRCSRQRWWEDFPM